jgi:Arc-like DNA binding domain
MAKKVVKTTKAGRGSDQFMVRMPPGMRSALAAEAEKGGRSMNAEIVGRLAFTFEKILSNEGLVAISKRLSATADAFHELYFDIRDKNPEDFVKDIDLEPFIADQRSKGSFPSRSQAIRLILQTYLSEKGFVREAKSESDAK